MRRASSGQAFADDYLVGRAQEGYLDAFEHLVRSHGPASSTCATDWSATARRPETLLKTA